MSSMSRKSQDSSETPQSVADVDRARVEYIRTVRALMGATPAQLVSSLGRPAQQGTPEGSLLFVQSPDRVSVALQALIGWYRDALGATPALANAANDEPALGVLVQQLLAVRARWEDREATALAARMTEHAMRRAIARRGPPAAVAPATGCARRRALLVDDASDVVVTVGAFLEAFGFDVERASSGDVALQVLASGGPFDLLVTDHAMPGLTGKDLAVQACHDRPGLRVLIITGYSDAEDLATLPPGVMVLAKPFRRAQLSERIRVLFEQSVVQSPMETMSEKP